MTHYILALIIMVGAATLRAEETTKNNNDSLVVPAGAKTGLSRERLERIHAATAQRTANETDAQKNTKMCNKGKDWAKRGAPALRDAMQRRAADEAAAQTK
jgi:hypothetical protein